LLAELTEIDARVVPEPAGTPRSKPGRLERNRNRPGVDSGGAASGQLLRERSTMYACADPVLRKRGHDGPLVHQVDAHAAKPRHRHLGEVSLKTTNTLSVFPERALDLR